jgi:S1-C subfamily serine protease
MEDYPGYGQPPFGSTMPMPPMPPRPPRRRAGLLSYLAVAVAAAALGAGSVVALYHPASSNSAAAPQPGSSAPAPLPSSAIPTPGSGGGSGTSSSEQAILNRVEPGLVIIDSTLQYSSEQGAGTGMVINSDGLVLTNNHVIEDSTNLSAKDLANGKTYPARVIGYDETGDIALIQLQGASGLRTVPVGNSGTLRTGASVLALGNANGQGMIVPAAGQIIALNQTITASGEGGTITSETLHGMIETDADIVSGDSGGPLADSAGQVIGMDTAGNNVSFPQQQSATGFAIPINAALSVIRQIAAGQASSTITIGYPPFMGVYIGQGSDSSPQAQAEQQQGNGFGGNGFGGNGFGGNGFGGNGFGGNGFGGDSGSGGSQGCYSNDSNLTTPQTIAPVSSGTLVVGVICGSPADAAGMTAGSVITAVNGQAIGSPENLTSVVSKYRPGQTVSVTWVSPSGQRTTSNLDLTSGPPQ